MTVPDLTRANDEQVNPNTTSSSSTSKDAGGISSAHSNTHTHNTNGSHCLAAHCAERQGYRHFPTTGAFSLSPHASNEPAKQGRWEGVPKDDPKAHPNNRALSVTFRTLQVKVNRLLATERRTVQAGIVPRPRPRCCPGPVAWGFFSVRFAPLLLVCVCALVCVFAYMYVCMYVCKLGGAKASERRVMLGGSSGGVLCDKVRPRSKCG